MQCSNPREQLLLQRQHTDSRSPSLNLTNRQHPASLSPALRAAAGAVRVLGGADGTGQGVAAVSALQPVPVCVAHQAHPGVCGGGGHQGGLPSGAAAATGGGSAGAHGLLPNFSLSLSPASGVPHLPLWLCLLQLLAFASSREIRFDETIEARWMAGRCTLTCCCYIFVAVAKPRLSRCSLQPAASSSWQPGSSKPAHRQQACRLNHA